MRGRTIKENLHWWAWKFCGKGVHEDAASDAMTAGLELIEELEAALKDMAQYIWRDDYQKLKPETRIALGDKK